MKTCTNRFILFLSSYPFHVRVRVFVSFFFCFSPSLCVYFYLSPISSPSIFLFLSVFLSHTHLLSLILRRMILPSTPIRKDVGYPRPSSLVANVGMGSRTRIDIKKGRSLTTDPWNDPYPKVVLFFSSFWYWGSGFWKREKQRQTDRERDFERETHRQRETNNEVEIKTKHEMDGSNEGRDKRDENKTKKKGTRTRTSARISFLLFFSFFRTDRSYPSTQWFFFVLFLFFVDAIRRLGFRKRNTFFF